MKVSYLAIASILCVIIAAFHSDIAFANQAEQRQRTKFPTNAPWGDLEYESYGNLTRPTLAPITATPTTGYPTSTPTRIKSDFHKWNITLSRAKIDAHQLD